jgi:uncharacterized protein (TIGR00730 family)
VKRAVAVFGSSEPQENDPLYQLAVQTGRELAGAGFAVVTGGYGGVMEGACRGAHHAGGEAVGVVVTSIFGDREPNVYLTKTIDTPDLYERTRLLIDRCDAYLVLAGRAGTLAELAWVWALARAGSLSPRPVIAVGEPWPEVLDLLERRNMLDPVALRMTERAQTAREAVEVLERRLAQDA